MSTLNLKSFERRMRVRRLKIEDFNEVVALQKVCFPGMKTWKMEQFESQIRTFPEGQVCVQSQDRIVASSASLIVDFDDYDDWQNWKAIADDGYIRNHDPAGDTLYGIEIMVHPNFRGQKLSRRLYDARKRLTRTRNLERIIIGGRIPGYGEHADRMSAREYVDQVMQKSFFDRVLTAQVANGFVLKRLIPDYFPTDTESRGYATFLEWTNLDFQATPRRHLHATSPVRLGVVQYAMRPVATFDEFARQCEFFIDVASDYKCDFLLFPELFTTQLLPLVKVRRPAEAARKLSDYTPRYLELFTRMALKYNVNIVGGSQFTVEDDRLYNVAYLFRRNGTIGKQYKLHVTPNERKWWGVNPGERVEVFETDRGKVAIQVCYDVEFPELARIATAKGAQLLFVPFNTDDRHGYLRVRYCAQARCIENHLYVAISGCTGNLPFVDNADVHYAQSGIYTPSDFPFDRDGIAEECTANIETVIIHDVDLATLRRHRHSGTVRNWMDRRTDLYTLRYREDGKRREV